MNLIFFHILAAYLVIIIVNKREPLKLSVDGFGRRDKFHKYKRQTEEIRSNETNSIFRQHFKQGVVQILNETSH